MKVKKSSKLDFFTGKKSSKLDFFTGKTPRRFHRLTHDRNKIWYYTYIREQY